MRTVIVSDTHLGNGRGYDIYAGGDALPALFRRESDRPTHFVLNGDAFDFLMDDEPLRFDAASAVPRAEAIVAHPESRAVLEAMGEAVARGSRVTLRLGNHDPELALPEVQAVLVRAAGGAPLRFAWGDAPEVLEVGRARVLLAHGEQNDPWNRLDYEGLQRGSFEYPPGSKLVKHLLNPLKRDFGLRFTDLLKPDFSGAVMAALAVSPMAVRVAFDGATLDVLWHLFRRWNGPVTFGPGDGPEALGLAERVDEAGLDAEERAALEALFGSGPLAFPDEEDGPLSAARVKLLRGGLSLYARLHRAMAGGASDAYFDLEPDDAEWEEARRLRGKFAADAVVIGHTHAARWRSEADLTYVNTGTWAGLMRLPPPDAGPRVWAEFLCALQENPALDPSVPGGAPVHCLPYAAVVEPAGAGARLTLARCEADGRLEPAYAQDLRT